MGGGVAIWGCSFTIAASARRKDKLRSAPVNGKLVHSSSPICCMLGKFKPVVSCGVAV